MTDAQPNRRPPVRHEDPAVAAAIEGLLALTPRGTRNRDLLRELLTATMCLPEAGFDRGELKIMTRAMQDFRRSFAAFDAHKERKKVSIFGSARTPGGSALYEHCREFSRRLVERGYMVITGAGPGIMQAGNEGATREHSFGVSIDLPFEAEANPVIHGDPKHIHFKYFFTRKLSFVKESDAIVLFPGGYGTLDEGFESLTLIQTGKCDPTPVILMELPGGSYWPAWERYVRENLLGRGMISGHDRNLYRFTSDIDKAIDEIELFYRCYHSLRYVGDLTILRLKHAPTPALLERLNTHYRDLLAVGDYEVLDEPHRAERGEPDSIKGLHRIAFRFVQRRYGRLRRLIDEINLAYPAPTERPALDPPTGRYGALKLPPAESQSAEDDE